MRSAVATYVEQDFIEAISKAQLELFRETHNFAFALQPEMSIQCEERSAQATIPLTFHKSVSALLFDSPNNPILVLTMPSRNDEDTELYLLGISHLEALRLREQQKQLAEEIFIAKVLDLFISAQKSGDEPGERS